MTAAMSLFVGLAGSAGIVTGPLGTVGGAAGLGAGLGAGAGLGLGEGLGEGLGLGLGELELPPPLPVLALGAKDTASVAADSAAELFTEVTL